MSSHRFPLFHLTIKTHLQNNILFSCRLRIDFCISASYQLVCLVPTLPFGMFRTAFLSCCSKQGGGAGPAQQPDPADEGYGALGGPGAQNQGPTLRELIKKVAPEGDIAFVPLALLSHLSV